MEEVIRHIIERPKDDWKYSIEKTIGDTKNRVVIKVRGDDLKQVLADLTAAKKGVI